MTAERNDSVAQFNDHKDSIYCIDSLPVAPFNILVSGDGADKAYVWRLTKNEHTEITAEPVVAEEPIVAAANDEEEKKEGEDMEEAAAPIPVVAQTHTTEKLFELVGHTETVEFCKFDSTGKWLVTGGMNNFLRVWDV